jgi:hypothetical protein
VGTGLVPVRLVEGGEWLIQVAVCLGTRLRSGLEILAFFAPMWLTNSRQDSFAKLFAPAVAPVLAHMNATYGHVPSPTQATPSNMGGVLDVVLEIAAGRREMLSKLRAALENGNDMEALSYARKLCGMGDHE